MELHNEQDRLTIINDSLNLLLLQDQAQQEILKLENLVRQKDKAFEDSNLSSNLKNYLENFIKLREVNKRSFGYSEHLRQIISQKNSSFMKLSQKLFGILGLENEKKIKLLVSFLPLPESLQALILGFIKNLQNGGLSHYLFDFLSPLISLDFDREEDRKTLKDKFPFLADHCSAYFSSNKLEEMLSNAVRSPEDVASYVAEDICNAFEVNKAERLFSNKKNILVRELTRLIRDSRDPNKLQPLRTREILSVYKKAFSVVIQRDEKQYTQQHIQQLKRIKAKEKLGCILFTPEDVEGKINALLSTYTDEKFPRLTKFLVDTIHDIIHSKEEYFNLSKIKPYIESLVLKVLLRAIEHNSTDNLGVENKDFEVTIIDKLLNLISRYYQEYQLIMREVPNEAAAVAVVEVLNEAAAVSLVEAAPVEAAEAVEIADEAAIIAVPDEVAVEAAAEDLRNKKQEELAKKNEELAKKKVELAKKIVDDILKTILGIPSSAFIQGLPSALQSRAYDNIKLQLESLVLEAFESLPRLGDDNASAAEAFEGLSNLLGDMYQAETIRGSVNQGVGLIIKSLAKPLNAQEMAVEPGVPVEPPLEAGDAVAIAEIPQDNSEMYLRLSQFLVNFCKTYDQLGVDKALEGLDPIKTQAVNICVNLVISPLNNFITGLFDAEDSRKQKLDITLVSDLVTVMGNHFECINQAKAKAKAAGKGEFSYKDFMDVAKEQLDDAVPRLVDVNNYDVDQQRQDGFYAGMSKQFLKILFPKGAEDLSFVPPTLRSPVWGLLTAQLSETALPRITEILSPEFIKEKIAGTLESAILSLDPPAPPAGEAPAPAQAEIPVAPVALAAEGNDVEFKKLDIALGHLVLQVAEMTTLPKFVIYLAKNKEGELRESALKFMIGSRLRQQLNGEFIRGKLKPLLQALPARFSAPPKPGEGPVVKAEPITDQRIEELTNKVIASGFKFLFNSIQKSWDDGHASLEEKIRQLFGPGRLALLGHTFVGIKHYVDLAFRTVFITILGTIISLLPFVGRFRTYLFQRLCQEVNTNRQNLMDVFVKIPEDQLNSERLKNSKHSLSLLKVLYSL